MPLRVALNVAYAMLTEGMDGKQRQKLDEDLYGWGGLNDRANRVLRMAAEEDSSGGES